jgi:outer membrane biogenesis lipoprotein LolB
MQTKLLSLISKTHRSFASVFLASSLGLLLFGCATTEPLSHSVTQVTQHHQVNLQTSEQSSQTNGRGANIEIAPPAYNSESQGFEGSWPFGPQGDD